MRLVVRDSDDGALYAFDVTQAYYDPDKGLCAEVRSNNEKTESIVIPNGAEEHVLSLARCVCLDLSDNYFVWDDDEDEEEGVVGV